MSVGSNTYNLTKYDKRHLTDVTFIKKGNRGSAVLHRWKNICNDIHSNGKFSNFIKSTQTTSPSSYSGAASFPPFGDVFLYMETSGGNHGYNHKFVSLKRTGIILITNIIFYYNRFSILTNDSLKSMVRFRIRLPLKIFHRILNILLLKIVIIVLVPLNGRY